MKGLWEDCFCYFCGSFDWLESHHIFSGPYRKKSEKYGYKVTLCHNHHNEPPDGVHFNKENRNTLKRICQKHFEQNHGTREDFIATFGKSYAEDEE